MIKNIVFDLGGVLVDYKPEKYLEHLRYSKEEIELFTKIVFYGDEWDEYNSSKLNLSQTEKKLIKRYPEYTNKLKEIFENIDFKYILFEIKETANYLKKLKEKGYSIYILSDASVESAIYNKQFEFFKYVKGELFSFEIGTTKPNKNNYEKLLKKYNLIPVETVFIDDRTKNVETANSLGIFGIEFTTLNSLKSELEKLK